MNRDQMTPFSPLPDARELPAFSNMGGSWALSTVESQPRSATLHPVLTPASLVLMALWLFIGAVAAYDVYLSVKYQDTLRFEELNPLGQWLLHLDNGSVAIFMGCKCLGTLIALGTTVVLYCYKRNLGLVVASALACTQAMVVSYLLFG